MNLFDPVGRVAALRRGLTRADVILAALPLLFVGGYALGAVLFDRHALAIGFGAAACCAVIGDGIFWHPPTDETVGKSADGERESSSSHPRESTRRHPPEAPEEDPRDSK